MYGRVGNAAVGSVGSAGGAGRVGFATPSHLHRGVYRAAGRVRVAKRRRTGGGGLPACHPARDGREEMNKEGATNGLFQSHPLTPKRVLPLSMHSHDVRGNV